MNKYLSILGAFDRYNYGDLLFPILLSENFNKKNPTEEYIINFFSTIKNDLSKCGGVRTNSISNLFKIGDYCDEHKIILSGGEILTCTWTIMYHYLNSNYDLIVRILRKLLDEKSTDNFLRFMFNQKTILPWIIEPDLFNCDVKIAYNAVGGSSLSYFDNEYKKIVIENLKKAKYISLRDNLSYKIIKELSSDIECKVSPDSAIIMSDIFSKDLLKSSLSPETKEIIYKNEGNYICFQSAKFLVEDKEDMIAYELKKIAINNHIPVVIFPIGLATGHEDQYIINELKKRLEGYNNIFFISENITILDIMAIIAFSRLYAGTSLHGFITAMSFGIQRICVSSKITKLIQFAQTWDLEEILIGIEYENLSEGILSSLKLQTDKYVEHSSKLKEIYYKDFEIMLEKLNT